MGDFARDLAETRERETRELVEKWLDRQRSVLTDRQRNEGRVKV